MQTEEIFQVLNIRNIRVVENGEEFQSLTT